MKNFLFLDLETTGLNPTEAHILEVGVIAVQLRSNGDVEVGGDYQSVIVPELPDEDSFSTILNSRVLKMHTENGLISDILKLKAPIRKHVVDDILVEFVESEFGTGATRIELAGSSIHFDLEFVKVHFPKLAKKLSYRVMDVTPYRTIRNEILDVVEPKSVAHRAMDDIQYSLSVFKEMVNLVKTKPKQLNPEG